MRWISIFRAVINYVYFFAFITAVLAPLTFWLASKNLDIAFNIGGHELENMHWSFYVVLFISMLGYFVFVRMLYLMKQVASRLNPRELFNKELAGLITKAGKNCILAALMTKIPGFLYIAIVPYLTGNDNRFEFSLSFGYGFDSLFVILSFGFFLMLTGTIIKEGVGLKQENDLTI